MTNSQYGTLVNEIETDVIIDTACMKKVSGEECCLNL